MKYFIPLIGCFLICFLDSNAQTMKYKSFSSKLIRYDSNHTEIENPEWEKSEILVVVNFDKRKVDTYGKETGNYDLVKSVGEKVDKDDNYYVAYDAIDKVGDKCQIIIKFVDNLNPDNCIAILGIVYPYGKLYIKLKAND